MRADRARRPPSPRRAATTRRVIPEIVWAPLVASLLLLVVGLLGLLTGHPWLFPSLGPTAFLYAEYPTHRTARFSHVVAGHCIGLGAGVFAVRLLGADRAPAAVVGERLAPIRVWAAVCALALTILAMLVLRASHPPAAATTLIVALGGLRPTVRDALLVAVSILILALCGEGMRRVRIRAGERGPAPEGNARAIDRDAEE